MEDLQHDANVINRDFTKIDIYSSIPRRYWRKKDYYNTLSIVLSRTLLKYELTM